MQRIAARGNSRSSASAGADDNANNDIAYTQSGEKHFMVDEDNKCVKYVGLRELM